MEFAEELESNIVSIRRGDSLQASLSQKEGAWSWTATHAAVGMNGLNEPILMDGVNDAGLAGGILYFPGFAAFTALKDVGDRKPLAPWDFLTWALTCCDSVAAVKEAITTKTKAIAVVDVPHPAFGGAPPVHYTLHDKSGASLVIQPIDGELVLHDNPLGVLTNSPPFDWHMINLRNYVNLTRQTPSAATISLSRRAPHVTLEPFGQGGGLAGVPGDTTPPSRFVRAVGYATAVQNPPSGLPAVQLAEHIMNTFDIPKGWVREGVDHGEPVYEYTQWAAIVDLSQGQYYFRTYDDPTLRVIGIGDERIRVVETKPDVEFKVLSDFPNRSAN